MTTIVYPGTFDPITLGHVDLVERVSPLFGQVVIAIAASPSKGPLFSLEERIELVRKVTAHLPNVTVKGFEGLITDFLDQEQATVMLRGIRSSSDVDYESQLAQINRIQRPGTESLFLSATPEYAGISSSIVKEIARLNGDVTRLVPKLVASALEQRLKLPNS